MSDIDIRLAQPEDVDTLIDIRSKAILSVNEGPYTLGVLHQWAKDLSACELDKELRREHRTHALIAIQNGNIVGFSLCDVRAQSIKMLYCWPPNLGAGRVLLQRSEADMLEKYCDAINIRASLNAIEFYQKHQYVPRESLPQPERQYPELTFIHMRKDFGGPS